MVLLTVIPIACCGIWLLVCIDCFIMLWFTMIVCGLGFGFNYCFMGIRVVFALVVLLSVCAGLRQF